MINKEMHIEDLLTDRNFIRWVKHPDEQLELYWKHWMMAHPERKPELLLAKEIVLRSDFYQVNPPDKAFDEVLQRLVRTKKSDGQRNEIQRQTALFNWHPLRMTAVLICIAVFTGILIMSQKKPSEEVQNLGIEEWIVKQNPRGQKTQIRLPDGTKVWLNSESKLDYPTHFSSLSREVNLTGEAFFEVVRDENRPFTVHSGRFSTTALGTSFNVSAYPEEETTAISLVSGKVVVYERDDGSGKQMILNPGEQALHTRNNLKMEKVTFNYESDISWKDGILVFNEADMYEIVAKLERWYGVDIQLIGKPDEEWRINGTFKNQSLTRVLDRLSFIEDFTYKLDNKNIVFNFRKPNSN